MKCGSLLLVTMILLVLTGCGGESPVEPTPVREPTLTFEERIQHPPGTAENPLQMVIRPTNTIAERLRLILAYETESALTDIQPDTSLRDDLGLGVNLAELDPALQRDFAVTIDPQDAPSISTVADLIDYVETQVGKQVTAALYWRTNMYITVIPVATYGEALRHLCNSESGIVSVAWLDGITYTAASARNCGEAGMQVAVAEESAPEFTELLLPEQTPESTPEVTPEATAEVTAEVTAEATADETPTVVAEVSPTETALPTDTPTTVPTDTLTPEPTATLAATPEATVIPEVVLNLRTGEAGVFIVNRELGTTVTVVTGNTFCRLGDGDFYSWLLPSLILAQSGIDPQYDAQAIVDYADESTLVQAVANGDCAAIGLPLSSWEMFGEIPGIAVAETTIEFPYGLLTYPLEVGLGVRLTLGEHLPALAADSTENRPLRLLLGQAAILPVAKEELAPLAAFMEVTGYDFAQMGD